MKKVSRHRGMKIHMFNGVPHIARKDVHHCFARMIKQINGRYYTSVENYDKGRKEYLAYKLRIRITAKMRRRKDIIRKWHDIVPQILHRNRCERLILALKTNQFGSLVRRSRCYADAKAEVLRKKTCPECGAPELYETKGPCECHICEDWSFSSSCRGDRRRDLLKCRRCCYSREQVSVLRSSYSYRYD